MSLTSGESRDLKSIAHSLGEMAKILKAMNENMLGLANNVNRVLEVLTETNGESYSIVSGDGSVIYTKHPEDLGIDPASADKHNNLNDCNAAGCPGGLDCTVLVEKPDESWEI